MLLEPMYIEQGNHPSCQVVAAINAALSQGIDMRDRYEEFVDLAVSRSGAALRIDRVHKELGLCAIDRTFTPTDIINKNLPIAVKIWHKRYGFHTCLITKVKGDLLWVHNLKKIGQNPFTFKHVLHMYNEVPWHLRSAQQLVLE